MKNRIAVFMLIGFGLPVAALATTPVTPVRDVENPARRPFVVEGSVEFRSGGTPTEIGQVPAGKRAVIEFISMNCQTVPPDTIINVTFFFPETNNFRQYPFPISKQGEPGGSIFQSWVAAQLVRIYADEGKISVIAITSNVRTDEAQGACRVNISGHTIRVE